MGNTKEHLQPSGSALMSNRTAWDAQAALRAAQEARPYNEGPRLFFIRNYVTIMVYSFAIAMVTAKLIYLFSA